MTDKQINIVEILAEQCKNCTLYEGDTISLTISIFDRPLRGVCFDNNIYFSVDELNYIIQKLISKEQECEELKNFHINLVGVKECEIKELAELKSENKHLNDLLNQALKELEKTRETLTEIKEIAEEIEEECGYLGFGSCANEAKEQILQKISEVEDE
jgi:hypothetical protein